MNDRNRIFSILLVLLMVLAMTITVCAQTEVDAKGSILIRDNDAVLTSEKTFEAYLALNLNADMDDDGVITAFEYAVPESLADFYAARYNADKTAGDFIVKVREGIQAEPNLFAFAYDVATAAKAAGVTPVSGSAVEGGYQFSDMDLGYYAIVDTTIEGDYIKPVTAVVLNTTTPNREIELKADKPSIDKNIDEDNDLGTTNDRVDMSQAAIGDTVTYVIDSKVPEMIGYKKYFFIVKDTMAKGLTYDNNMVITVGDKTLAADTDYTLTVTENEDGTTGLKIVFNDFLQYNTEEFIGKKIEITYTAILNENAELYEDANTNKVYLEYSANPSVDYEGENEPDYDEGDKDKEPLGETSVVTVETFTTALELIKTDAMGNRLQGAEFTLSGETMNIVRVTSSSFELDENGEYWKLTDGSYTTTDPESTIDGAPVDKSVYENINEKYTRVTNVERKETEGGTVSIDGAVGEDGVLRFEGLKAGTYTIKEINAPEGYDILQKELEVTIHWGEEAKAFTYEGAVDNNGVASLTVVNQTGTELPSIDNDEERTQLTFGLWLLSLGIVPIVIGSIVIILLIALILLIIVLICKRRKC